MVVVRPRADELIFDPHDPVFGGIPWSLRKVHRLCSTPMRSVFVFPAGEPAETVDSLDRHLPEQRNPWTVDGNLYIEIVDEQTGYLFSDWDPDDVAVLEAAVGHRPTWSVRIDISGRIDGTAEVHQLVELLLEYGGVAIDDYSAHPWSLPEIKSGAVNDGLCFFDFRTYHQLKRE